VPPPTFLSLLLFIEVHRRIVMFACLRVVSAGFRVLEGASIAWTSATTRQSWCSQQVLTDTVGCWHVTRSRLGCCDSRPSPNQTIPSRHRRDRDRTHDRASQIPQRCPCFQRGRRWKCKWFLPHRHGGFLACWDSITQQSIASSEDW
jgi:hypothetical protein